MNGERPETQCQVVFYLILFSKSLDPKPDKKSKPKLRVYKYNTHFVSFLTDIKCNNKTLLADFIIF